MRAVELRSETMTRPTSPMRRAMADADVGDDVFGEDPTVNSLEAMAAERLGKGAALFVPSGTMANLVSQMAHCGRGDEMILGNLAHASTTSKAALRPSPPSTRARCRTSRTANSPWTNWKRPFEATTSISRGRG